MSSLSKKTVVEIFAVMRSRYQSRWLPTNRSGGKDDKATGERAVMAIWFEDLKALGVTDQTARLGLGRSRTLHWPPSPAEFAEMCLPTREDIGVPGDNEAYQNLCQVVSQFGLTRPEKFAHPAIHAAACAIGTLIIRTAKDGQLRRLFNYDFTIAVSRCLRGDSPYKASPHALPGHVEQDVMDLPGCNADELAQDLETTSPLET